ncbi:PQQ-binding-like beta-propeller repeat protein [bacterium]|nr:PQQ-binding-like beta-propeller repeat protein [bacterium]
MHITALLTAFCIGIGSFTTVQAADYTLKPAAETISGSNPGEIAVIAFHNVLPSKLDTSQYSLPPLLFEKMIDELIMAGYHFLSTREYIDYIVKGAEIPAKSVLLTFDDGMVYLYDYVYPILQKKSIHATIFLIASRYVISRYLDATQIREMHDSGLVDFQSHTFDLHDFSDGEAAILKRGNETDYQYKQRIINDFRTSIVFIEDLTGEPVTALALPYGIGNETIEAYAKEAGFEAVFYIGEDTTQTFGDNPFHLNRVIVYRFNAKVLIKLHISNHYGSNRENSEAKPALTAGNPATDSRIRTSGSVHDAIIYSSPAIGPDGTVYIGSWDNCLYAVNPDGTTGWTYKTTAGISSSPVIGPDGAIYACSFNSYVYAINREGSLRWKYVSRAPIFSSPAVGEDGSVYFATTDRDLIALNSDGSFKWQFWVGDLIHSSPSTGKDGTIYFGAWNSILYAVTPEGKSRWSFQADAPIDSSPAIGEDGTIYFGCMDNRVYAIHPDGSLLWTYGTEGYVDSSPSLGADGTIYVGSWDTCLYAINHNGTLLWKFKTGGKIESSPAVGADGIVYIGSDDGCLYAVDPHGGEKWHVLTGGAISSSPALTHDGTLYVGSMDSYLYGIDTGTETGLAVSPWPKFGANSRNTSRIWDMSAASTNSSESPIGFSIIPPCPNPFNASVAFRYTVPSPCHVDILIYDILGRKVMTLAQDAYYPGYHEMFWRGCDDHGATAGTGVYIYRFNAGNYTAQGKIMLLR